MKKLARAAVLALMLFAAFGTVIGCKDSVVRYKVTVEPTEHGTVTVSESEPEAGASVTVTATADSGYMLGTLTAGGAELVATPAAGGVYTAVINNVQSDLSVGATFTEIKFTSLTAAFTQGTVKVYSTDTMDTLKTRIASVLSVTAAKNDGTEETDITDYTLSCADWGAGVKTVTVSYAGVTDTISVNVTARALVSVKLKEAFDQTGITIYASDTPEILQSKLSDKIAVVAHYNDGTDEEVTEYSLTLSGSSVQVEYNNALTSFDVEVTAVALESITAAWNGGEQSVTVYASVGAALKDKIAAAITVTGHNNDGSTVVIPAEKYNLVAFVIKPPTTTAIIQLIDNNKMSTTLSVTVTAVELTSITAAWNGGAQSVTVYDSCKPDELKGKIADAITVTGHNNDGSTVTIPAEDYNLAAFVIKPPTTTAIIQFTTGNSTTMSTMLSVEITAKALTGIELGAFDQTGITINESDSAETLKEKLADNVAVKAVYNDGSKTDVAGSDCTFSWNGDKVTVSYEGKTAELTVDVTPVDVASVKLKETFDQGDVKIYGSDTDAQLTAKLAGKITVIAVYIDGGEREVSGYTLSRTDTTVTVTYRGQTTTFTVTLSDEEQNGLRVVSFGEIDEPLYIDELADLDDAALKELFADALSVCEVLTSGNDGDVLTAEQYTLSVEGRILTVTQIGTEFSTVTPIAVTLRAPTDVAKNGNTISWTAVEGADSYIVRVVDMYGCEIDLNGTMVAGLTDTVETNSYTVTYRNFIVGDAHTVYVTAAGEGCKTSAAGEYDFVGENVHDFTLAEDRQIFQSAIDNPNIYCDTKAGGKAAARYNEQTGAIDVTVSKQQTAAYVDFNMFIRAGQTVTFVVEAKLPAVMQGGPVYVAIADRDSPKKYWLGNGDLGREARGEAGASYCIAGNGTYRISACVGKEYRNFMIVFDAWNCTTEGEYVYSIKSVTVGNATAIDFSSDGQFQFFDGNGSNTWDEVANSGSAVIEHKDNKVNLKIKKEGGRGFANVYQPVQAGWRVTFDVDVYSISAGTVSFKIAGRTVSEKPSDLDFFGLDKYTFTVERMKTASFTVSGIAPQDYKFLFLVADVTGIPYRLGDITVGINRVTVAAPNDRLDRTKFDGDGCMRKDPLYCDGDGKGASLAPDKYGNAVVSVRDDISVAYVDYHSAVEAGDVITAVVDVDMRAATAGGYYLKLVRKGGGETELCYAEGKAGVVNRHVLVGVADQAGELLFFRCDPYQLACPNGFTFTIRSVQIEKDADSSFDARGYDVPVYAKDKHMDIIAWDVPDLVKTNQEGFDEVAEAGYTVMMPHIRHMDFKSDTDNALAYMDKAHNAGLKVLVMDTALCDPYDFTGAAADDRYVDMYKDHPAFYGLHINDEAEVSNFAAIGRKMDRLRAKLPGKMLFMNTNPKKVTQEGWEEQLTKYIAEAKPMVLSYDDYALYENGSVKSNYFTAMATARYFAKNNNLPSNNFITTSGGYNHILQPNFRHMEEADIRWQTYCNMAYGYDSIAHFAYEQWKQTSDGSGTADATIDHTTLEPTGLYYKIQAVNSEVHSWDHVYKSFTWQGTDVIGDNSLFSSLKTSAYRTDIKNAADLTAVTATKSALAGRFVDGNGNIGFMVTNADEADATDVTLTFADTYGAVLVYRNGVPTVIELTDGQTVLNLAYGDGAFVIPLAAKA